MTVKNKKKVLKRILLALLIFFIAIQFIQPVHNKSEQVLPTDFSNLFHPPQEVDSVLKYSCYDCHSNNTHYPWYSNIQPFAWFMAHHIRKGKAEINFSEYGSYSLRRQISKLKDVEGSVKDRSMPLGSYTLIHRDSKLSPEERKMIIGWLEKTRGNLSKNE